MANDPSAPRAVGAAAPSEPEYEAVYAAVTATERGRRFLAQFASRNRHADTDTLVAAVSRIEAAIRGEAVPATPEPTAAVAAAIERLQDIAFEFRERWVHAALCDCLDAAIRELSAAVLGEPAAPPPTRRSHVKPPDFALRSPHRNTKIANGGTAFSATAATPAVTAPRDDAASESPTEFSEVDDAPPNWRRFMATDPLAEIRALSEEELIALFH